jgi:hypothetical protein
VRPALLLVLALGLLSGCAVTTERYGDPHYLTQAAKLPWRLGSTTPLEVAQQLGPPDEFARRDQELWFLYRFRDTRSSRFVLSYYLNVFQRSTVHSVDSQLVVVFDADDRLLFHGFDELPASGEFMRHFD